MAMRNDIDIFHEYLNAWGDEDDDEPTYIRKSIGEGSCGTTTVHVHLFDGFTYPMKYTMNISREPTFYARNLAAYYNDRNRRYNSDAFISCNTFRLELLCICRCDDIFSDHHRIGYIDTFTFVNDESKKMLLRSLRYLMYVIEKCLSCINVDHMTCDDIQKYILWQEGIFIKDKCILYHICENRSVLTTVVTW